MEPNATCRWIACCRETSVDNSTGLLSMHDIVGGVTIAVPGLHQAQPDTRFKRVNLPLDIVTRWERKEAVVGSIAFRFRLRFIDSTGVMLFDDIWGDVEMEGAADTFFATTRLGTLVVTVEGMYKVQVIPDLGTKREHAPVLQEVGLHIKFDGTL